MMVGGWARGGCAPHYSLKDSGELSSPSCPPLSKAEDNIGALRTLCDNPSIPSALEKLYFGLGYTVKWETIHSNGGSGRLGGSLGLWTAVCVDLHCQATRGAKPAPVGAYWVYIYLFPMPCKPFVGFGVED